MLLVVVVAAAVCLFSDSLELIPQSLCFVQPLKPLLA